MCHDPASRPPSPPRHEEVAVTRRLTLGATTLFSAAYAAPTAPRVGVVVLPDVRGLHAYYIDLVARFAEAGLAAVAIDYFGRTAGLVDEAGRPGDFPYTDHLPSTTPEQIDADATEAIAYLRVEHGADLPIVTVGFCFGGSNSWRMSGSDVDVAACIGFYGRPSMVGDAADRAHRPTLMLIAGADAATPVEDQLTLADRMRAAGAEVTTAVYDGAPHSFFDRHMGEWDSACADAWTRILTITDALA